MKQLFVLTVFLLSACATNDITISQMNQKIPHVNKVYVSRPSDGLYGDKKYSNSGVIVQNAVSNYLYKVSDNVENASIVSDVEHDMHNAKKSNASVLISPQITHWEDRNTPWSGRRDRVELIISAYNLKNNSLMNRAKLYATSSKFTFINDRPQVLLDKMLEQYINTVAE